MEAALRSDLIRGYVRLYKTPPARVRLDNSAQEQARLLLLVLVQVRGRGEGHEEGRGGALGRYEGGLHAMAWRGGIIATRSCGNRSE